MPYRTTRKADEDIIAIYVQGAMAFGTAQAERYHTDLIGTFDLLAANPAMARLRAQFDPPLRVHPHGAHVVVYLEDATGILIVRVLHKRQDPERHLG
jgi:toxin ParE1/3/4